MYAIRSYYEQVPQSVRDGMTIGGKVYAIPYTTDTRGLYYNVKVLQSAGIALPCVITSYSIHYTKLYDATPKALRQNISSPTRMASVGCCASCPVPCKTRTAPAPSMNCERSLAGNSPIPVRARFSESSPDSHTTASCAP